MGRCSGEMHCARSVRKDCGHLLGTTQTSGMLQKKPKKRWHADVLQCCLFGCIDSDLIKLCAVCSGSGTQGLLLVHLLQTALAASHSCVSFHLKAQVECVRRAHRVVHPSKNMALELNGTGCHADGGGHMLYTTTLPYLLPFPIVYKLF